MRDEIAIVNYLGKEQEIFEGTEAGVIKLLGKLGTEGWEVTNSESGSYALVRDKGKILAPNFKTMCALLKRPLNE